MKKKTESESKIFTPSKNTNQKKVDPDVPAVESAGSLLKKNEFTMILVAALVVTVLVFFFFFKGSSSKQEKETAPSLAGTAEQAAPGFEERISALEVSLARFASSSDQDDTLASSRAVSDLEDRVTRIESALNLKLDTLIEHVDKLESRLNKKAVVSSAPPSKPKPGVKKPTTPAPVPEKKVKTAKKKVEKSKKTGQFHTVQKNETLWSISQKYNTSVAAIRKLNNMTPEDKIYPGSNLLVK